MYIKGKKWVRKWMNKKAGFFLQYSCWNKWESWRFKYGCESRSVLRAREIKTDALSFSSIPFRIKRLNVCIWRQIWSDFRPPNNHPLICGLSVLESHTYPWVSFHLFCRISINEWFLLWHDDFIFVRFPQFFTWHSVMKMLVSNEDAE